MRENLYLRELTTNELWQEIQQLRVDLETHNHLSTGVQVLNGEVNGILRSPGFVSGVSGYQILPSGVVEFNEGYFRSQLAVGTSPNWFKVDASGNIWSGNATLAGAQTNTFAVTNAGALYCKSATISGSTIDGTSTLGGRLASILASAINASGNFIDANLNTSTKKILSDFTLDNTNYAGAFKSGTITWDTTTGLVTGGTGFVINDKGILGALAGATKISILNDGSATFAGALSAATGTFAGTVQAAAIIVGTGAGLIETSSLANLPSDANLVGYWSFDEGTGATAFDGSNNGKNATLYNTPSWVQGIAGTALTLSNASSQYISIPALGNQFSNGISFSFWLQTDTSVSSRQRLLTSQEFFTAYFEGSTDEYLVLVIYNSGWGAGVVINNFIKRDNIKHFYVITVNGSTIQGYRDGNLIGSGNDSKTLVANMTNVLTPFSVGNAEYVNGTVDELRIYNAVLIAKEIYALYKNPSGNPSLSLFPGRLTAGNISSKQIVLGSSWIAPADALDTYIASGKNDFTNTDAGFILGLDNSDSNKAKFYIGNTTRYLNWTGTLLEMRGSFYTDVAGQNRFQLTGYNLEVMNSSDKMQFSITGGQTTWYKADATEVGIITGQATGVLANKLAIDAIGTNLALYSSTAGIDIYTGNTLLANFSTTDITLKAINSVYLNTTDTSHGILFQIANNDKLTILNTVIDVTTLLRCNSSGNTPHINFNGDPAPSSPNDGDFWFDGTELKIRVGVTTYTLDKTAV